MRLQKMKFERKQQARQREAAAKDAKTQKVDAFAQKKGGSGPQQKQKEEKQEKEDAKQQAKAVPRGKKAKLQKMKDKYADQDEDERAMRLQLLGAKKTKGFEGTMQHVQKKAFIPAATTQQESEEEEEAVEEVTDQPVEEEKKEDTTSVAAVEDEEVVGEENKSEDEDDEEEPANEDEEKKEIEQLMKEEDINIVPEDVDLAEIDKLTGIPKANDLVLALVPMCAPYSAIQTYKYKVKLQVGTHKRGKAQKLIKNLFV